MVFEILINELFLKMVTTPLIASAGNKSILSLINDFEDKSWRYQKFKEFVWDNIAFTALSEQERAKRANEGYSTLTASAQNLRLTDKSEDIGKGSELAEIVLYGIMRHHFKALPVVPKIFYKQNVQDNAKGADSVHIVLEGEDDFSLWFGEAKFYNSIENARLPAVIESVKNSLQTDKLKKENSIITNTSDIDHLIPSVELVKRIKAALSNQNSIDQLKPKIHVPILLLHECVITSGASELTDDYRQKIKAYHLERARSYFEKQITALASDVGKYAEIKFHIILFPVPDRARIVDDFVREIAHFKS